MAFLFNRKRLPEGFDPSRVPPGQTLAAADKWPLLHFGPVPKIDLATWSLRIFGLVENELTWDHQQLSALPQANEVADIHCVTGWSRLNDTWTGVPISELLERARPLPEATYVMAHCEHGYATGMPLEVFSDSDVMLCTGWNGQELTLEHGWPCRLLVPKKYFWKSAKWLRGVEFLAKDRLGFWEKRGYHEEADPWQEKRYW